MSIDIKIYEEIKISGINLILSLPCIMLKGLLRIVEEKKDIQHITITREEEGVGIAAGAYLGGRIPAILMQNSGLGNSINAIKSLLHLFRIPVVFIMSHRGAEGEKIAAQIPMGQLTLNLLDLAQIPTYIIDSSEKIKEITQAVNNSINSNNSVGIVLQKKLWSVCE